MLSLLFVAGLTPSVLSQNLVPNGSFELITSDSCVANPTPDMFNCVMGWYTVQGNPDYVNQRINDHSPRAPKAMEGEATTGLYLPYPGSRTLEFVEVRLNADLEAGAVYVLRVYVAKDLKHYPRSIDGIGVLLSDIPLADQITGDEIVQLKKILKLNPQVLQPQGKPLAKRGEWMLIEGEFKATGKERYLSIGRFRFGGLEEFEKGAYYYFDALSLIRKEVPLDFAALVQPDTSIVLPHIYFESGSATLGAGGQDVLDQLVRFLQNNPEIDIEILGYTDDLGSEADNLKLSLVRAQEVVEYLSKQSIDPGRLTATAMGEASTMPDSRSANRRIEIRVRR